MRWHSAFGLCAALFVAPLFAAESAVAAPPPFAAPLQWTASDALVRPASDTRGIVSVKDPSIVRYNDRWHIYTTTADTNGAWGMVYLSFADVNPKSLFSAYAPHCRPFSAAWASRESLADFFQAFQYQIVFHASLK